MREKLPYTYSSPVDLSTPEDIKRVLQDIWQQIARVVNQVDDSEPYKPEVVQVVQSIVNAEGTIIQANDLPTGHIADFNDLTPQAPSVDYSNGLWQLDPDKRRLSVYLPKRDDIGIFGSTIFGGGDGGGAASFDFAPYSLGVTSVETALPVGGWFRNLHARTSDTQDALTSVLRMLLDAEVYLPLKVSVPSQQLAGVFSNFRSALRVEKGETFRFNWKQVGGATAGAALRSCAVEFATDDGSSILGWRSTAGRTLIAGGSEYLSLFTDTVHATSLDFTETIITFPGTLRNALVLTNGTQPASGSLVFTIYKNGVATGVVVTVPASGALGSWSDFVNTVAVVKGDRIGVLVLNNAAGVSTNYRQILFTVLPSASTKTCVIGGNMGSGALAIGSGATLYFPLFNNGSATLARAPVPLTRAGVLRNVYARRGSGGGSGNDLTYTIMKNDVATAISFFVDKTDTPTGKWFSDLVNTVSWARSDTAMMRVVAGAGTTTNLQGWSAEFAA